MNIVPPTAIGRPLAEMGAGFPWPAQAPATNSIITIADTDFTTGWLPTLGTSASGTWTTANRPVAVPFSVQTPLTVYQLGWVNGTAAGGNVDIGIYDTAWNRLVSGGSTVGSGNSVWQWKDTADIVLDRGTYYLCMVIDNTTANRTQKTGTAVTAEYKMVGCYDASSGSQFPLPNPLANMAPYAGVGSGAGIPIMGLAYRTLV